LQKKQKKNPFSHLPWHGKPYNFFGDYLESKYGCRVFKLPIDAGLGCPNRDGTVSHGGCIFCSEEGSASPTSLTSEVIIDQMRTAVTSFSRSFKDSRYIAYFQAFSNTYASTDILRKLYDTALSFPDIVGLMIGTRPDCIDSEKAALIASYRHSNFELWIEIGMQSMHNKSLSFLNRGHTHDETRHAIDICAKSGIDVCLHVILGIPGESWDDMMRTADEISILPVRGIKIHHLHVIRNTPLADLYAQHKISMLTHEEYVSTLCDFLERIRSDILVHRIIGDREKSSLIAPQWGMLKGTVQKSIDAEFSFRGSWQGFLS
jgi:radical SAM protein (TIGR01212 family)